VDLRSPGVILTSPTVSNMVLMQVFCKLPRLEKKPQVYKPHWSGMECEAFQDLSLTDLD
jgi:hypothetical protein